MPPVQIIRGYTFSLDPTQRFPIAISLPAAIDVVVGSVVRLDFTNSFDPDGKPLTYTPTFTTIPIGSQVEQVGFTQLEDDGSIVSFAPDVPGHYEVGLVVSNGKLDSTQVFSEIDVKLILVPQDKGITPDAGFIWNYLSDFWAVLDNRKMFDTFWSACIQIISAQLIELYQIDYNKSIRDIQDLFQRRWLSYELPLVLDATKTTFILADDQAGLSASSIPLDPLTGIAVVSPPDFSNTASIPLAEGNFATTASGQPISVGRILKLGKRGYTLARTGQLFESVNYGMDGQSFVAVGGSSEFLGSGFVPGILGMTLRILAPSPGAGDYLIVSVLSSTQLQLQTLTGGIPNLTAHSGLTYTVIPAQPTRSAFFGDQVDIPTRFDNVAWRFSATLISQEWDFEQQGVSPGDVLEVGVQRLDNNQTGSLSVQVVSVDRNRLGFVFNLAQLVDGTAAGGLSQDAQLQLADQLQVSGLMVTQAVTLFYTDQAAQVNVAVNSLAFRRQYFEQSLSAATNISVGPFQVNLIPQRIRRNSAFPVDTRVTSIPTLQEYIKVPQLVRVGNVLSNVTDSGIFPLDHEPFILIENLDYIVDNESTISGTCNVTAGSDELVIPFGDLIDRSISDGDTFVVGIGALNETFTVVEVVDAETVRVTPTPTLSDTGVSFQLTRRTAGTFVRFVNNTFGPQQVSPERCWAEVTFFDNNDVIEANFGSLVGVTVEDLQRQNSVTPYSKSIAGLMFALTGGSTIANLTLAMQVFFGLPFAQFPGFIKQIDPNYRLRDDGSPLLGRIVIQAVDQNQQPTGMTNIYFYPQGRFVQDPTNPGVFLSAIPSLAGLGTNPNTGNLFQVGDFVAQFTPLSNGLQVQDYLSAPDWLSTLLNQGNGEISIQKYHSFQILANADVVDAGDVDLAARFLKDKSKPTYTQLYMTLLRSAEDYIEITDVITFSFGVPPQWAEMMGLSLPRATKADNEVADISFLADNGIMYSWYYAGSDLITTIDLSGGATTNVTSPTGGFITPIIGSGQSHDSPFLQTGDLLIILDGPNAGQYTIDHVVSDTVLALDMNQDIGHRVFQSWPAQDFQIFRPIINPIYQGTVAVTHNSATAILSSPTGAAIFSAGVAADDVLVFFDPANPGSWVSQIYRIAALNILTNHLTLKNPVVEATGSWQACIVREGLLQKYFFQKKADPAALVATFFSGSSRVTFDGGLSDTRQVGLLRPGDILQPVTTVGEGSKSYIILDWQPSTFTAYVTPTPDFSSVGEGVKALLPGRGRGDSPITADLFDRTPSDYLKLYIYRRLSSTFTNDPTQPDLYDPDEVSPGNNNPTAVPHAASQVPSGRDLLTTSGSNLVSTVSGENFATMNVCPGDYLVILEGADASTDNGYGAGLFVVAGLASSTQIQLTQNLTVTNTSPGILYGIVRIKPNEGRL